MQRTDGHVAFECPCGRPGCCYCEGGLFGCVRCGGVEGLVPTECPGVLMDQLQAEEVFCGRLDFRDGMWIHKRPCGVCRRVAEMLGNECPNCRH